MNRTLVPLAAVGALLVAPPAIAAPPTPPPHASPQLEAYTRGLRFAFAPLAPESGPSTRP